MSEFIIRNGVLWGYHGGESLVVIPDEVSIIAESAFDNNHYIQTVLIPYTVTAIRDNAFLGCYNLSEVGFSGYPGEISFGKGVFRNCDKLAGDDGLIVFGNICFGAARGVKKVVIPEDVDSIAAGAFESNLDITEVYMHPNVEFVAEDAFKSCSNLSELKIENPYIDIMSGAFEGCYKLGNGCIVVNGVCYGAAPDARDVVIPEGVVEIDAKAFYVHKVLRSVVIPKSVRYVGTMSFAACSNLEKITVLGNKTDFGSGAFSTCNNIREIYTNSDITDYKMGRVTPQNPVRVNNFYLVAKEILVNAIPAFATRLRNGEEYIDSTTHRHIDYISYHVNSLMELAVSNPDLLWLMLADRMLDSEQINKYLDYAIEMADVQVSALLLNYLRDIK